MEVPLKLYLKANDRFNTSMRNLFDHPSAEYNEKEHSYRLRKIKQIVLEGYDFNELIKGYSQFYRKENKPHVLEAIPNSLVILIEQLKKECQLNQEDLNYLKKIKYQILTEPLKVYINPIISIIIKMLNTKPAALEESHLRKSNPWQEILKDGTNILKKDKEFISKLNERGKEQFKYQDDLPPEPFHGNPFEAEIFLLALNPGYVKKEQEYLEKNDGLKGALIDNLAFGNEKYPLIFMDPRFKDSPGREWWDKKLAPLFRLGYSPEIIAKKVCHLQFFPYHSAIYKSSKTILDSQRYTFDLLRYAIQNKKMIILLRSEKLWIEQVPELKGNYCKLNSYRNVVLSEKNLGLEHFRDLRKLLDK